MDSFIYQLTVWTLPVLLNIVVHEFSHGYVAYLLGDMTAKARGRLTLNPKEHIDPYGTIAFPLLLLAFGSQTLFGWAKPIPVNCTMFKKPKRDMGIVASAGPISNLILAFTFAFLLKLVILNFNPENQLTNWIIENLTNGFHLALALAVFNLIPILPLDGGRILASCLPLRLSFKYQATERHGLIILLVILFIFPALGFDIAGHFMRFIASIFYNLINFLL